MKYRLTAGSRNHEMERKEILEKIEAVKREMAEDQLEIIEAKIRERTFHHHKSDRKWFLGKLIEALRRKLMMETEFILEPLLDNQKEINLRLLEEFRRLKKEVSTLEKSENGKEKNFQNQDSQPADQE